MDFTTPMAWNTQHSLLPVQDLDVNVISTLRAELIILHNVAIVTRMEAHYQVLISICHCFWSHAHNCPCPIPDPMYTVDTCSPNTMLHMSEQVALQRRTLKKCVNLKEVTSGATCGCWNSLSWQPFWWPTLTNKSNAGDFYLRYTLKAQMHIIELACQTPFCALGITKVKPR